MEPTSHTAQIKIEPQIKLEAERLDFLISKNNDQVIYHIPSIFPSLSLIGLSPQTRQDFPLWQSIMNFVKFVNETRHIQLTVDIIKENTCLKIPGPEIPNILDLFGFVLFKYCFRNSTIFSFGCDSNLLALVVLRLAIFQKQSKGTQANAETGASLRVRVPSDNQFWSQVQNNFFFIEPHILKSHWEKLKRKQPLKRNWCREEINMLKDIVKNTNGKKLWSVVARSLAHSSGGKFRRNGKQCSEKWKSIVLENGHKRVWSKREDVILLKCVLEAGFDWRKISEKMKFKSKYIIKRRFHKILRKYKLILAKKDSLDSSDRETLQGIIYNLENSDKFFCPLFYSQNKEKSPEPKPPHHEHDHDHSHSHAHVHAHAHPQAHPHSHSHDHLHSMDKPPESIAPSDSLADQLTSTQLQIQNNPLLFKNQLPPIQAHILPPQLHHQQHIQLPNRLPITSMPRILGHQPIVPHQVSSSLSPSLGFRKFYDRQIHDYNFSNIPFSVPKILTCQRFANLDFNKAIEIAHLINPHLNCQPNLVLQQRINTPSMCLMEYFLKQQELNKK